MMWHVILYYYFSCHVSLKCAIVHTVCHVGISISELTAHQINCKLKITGTKLIATKNVRTKLIVILKCRDQNGVFAYFYFC